MYLLSIYKKYLTLFAVQDVYYTASKTINGIFNDKFL